MLEPKIEELSKKIEGLTERIDILIAVYSNPKEVIEKFKPEVVDEDVLIPVEKQKRKRRTKAELVAEAEENVPVKEDDPFPISDDEESAIFASTDAGSGGTPQYFHESEAGFWKNADKAEVDITVDDVRLAAKELIECDTSGPGLKKAKEVLLKFKFKSLAEVKKEKYSDLYHAFKNEVSLWK